MTCKQMRGSLTRWGWPANILAISLLAGCSADTPPPAVEIKPVIVEKPVAVPCLALDKIPDEPARIGDKLTGEVSHDLDLTAGVAISLRDWGESMHAALVACAG